VLTGFGHECHHWPQIGDGDDPDDVLLEWARTQDAALITADLDFGLLLARSGTTKPSLALLVGRTPSGSRLPTAEQTTPGHAQPSGEGRHHAAD
jgi:predicted nuclease of predicted toxin-antitoxin system